MKKSQIFMVKNIYQKKSMKSEKYDINKKH